MSISNQIKVITRVVTSTTNIQKKYADNTGAGIELNKLQTSLSNLIDYLQQLDQLKPNYNTNEINQLVEAIVLHMDILKVEMEEKDYEKIANGVKVIKTMMKFHPIKYTYITFAIAWLFELMYFV
jgi:hypothetical protein